MAETLQQEEAVIDALQVMAEKTGIYGMLGGQSVDVENDGKAFRKKICWIISMRIKPLH